MAKIHKRTVQKNLHDQDNHDGVMAHLEPDILECEVMWALGSITMNKTSGEINAKETNETVAKIKSQKMVL